jgi:hypothetical protein
LRPVYDIERVLDGDWLGFATSKRAKNQMSSAQKTKWRTWLERLDGQQSWPIDLGELEQTPKLPESTRALTTALRDVGIKKVLMRKAGWAHVSGDVRTEHPTNYLAVTQGKGFVNDYVVMRSEVTPYRSARDAAVAMAQTDIPAALD